MKRSVTLCLFIILIFVPLLGFAQVRIYNTVKLSGEAPVIDGLINEDVWEAAEWSGDFTQQEPYEFADPSQQTAVKVLYDDNNLYVAVRAFDTEPAKIERRMGRRDSFEGDWIAVSISSHNDDLTGYGFSTNAAGVKGDGRVSNDNEWDDTWNPVYYVKTSIDAEGWIAEMQIPLNQLRFAKMDKHVWGFEVMRYLFRKEEMSLWQMVPKDASGWVSRWGKLYGIENINPKKEIALTPYLMGSLTRSRAEEGNPYQTGTKWNYNAGLDGKIAVTNDLTLNFTINPDFGQVEADPSQVNLSAFESYFSEQRPFFIEGSNIFNYPLDAGESWSRENLFYSRRIGRRPNYYPEINENEYVKSPEFTRILGAFKLSGKTKNGWSIGVMESLTNNEHAKVDSAGIERKRIVEPMTNYFNTRIQKDINKGKTILGAMVTATNRFINDSVMEFLPSSAYSAGIDFNQYWDKRTYNLQAKIIGSSVTGSEEAILNRQQAPQRYYQRPDAPHLSVDSSLMQLSGYGGSFMLGKIGRGHWRYGVKGTVSSPGLSLNDMGYMRRGDAINQSGWVEYTIWEPFSVFRKMDVRINQWFGWDFNGTQLYSGIRGVWDAQFKNYWSVDFSITREGFDIDRHQLRGGPAVRTPGMWRSKISVNTDERKKLVADIFVYRGFGSDDWRDAFDIGLEISYRPLPSLQFSVDPVYVHDRESLMYIETIDFDGNTRYIVSGMDAKELQLNFRINYSLTPNLTFQYWGQPFFFSGDYHNFSKVVDAGNTNYYEQFYEFNDDEIVYDKPNDQYLISENGDGNIDYSFDNPDFSFYEFRSNFVIRWEYVPGSTAYFVWSQGRDGSIGDGGFFLSDHIRNLANAKASNVFLLKLSYRLSF